MQLDKRQLVAGGAAAALAVTLPPAYAQPKPTKLNVYAHRVHRTVAVGTQGGDITAEFTKATGIGVEWVTFDTGPLRERLFREASLAEGGVDIGFLLNTWATPAISNLFEPLDAMMAKDPLEDPADIFPGLMKGMSVGGKTYGAPFRHASSGLHYNEAIFEERGIKGAPKTIEELIEAAKACTYTRGGQPVVGLVLPGVTYPNVIDIARAWDGEFITPDFRVVANEEPMLKAVTLLRELFVAGAFPRNFAAIKTEDVNVWMQTGRAAMCINSLGRTSIYNDPQKSQFPGRLKTATIPVAKELIGKFAVAPAKVEFWGMGIPKNAKNKEHAWALIRAMLTKQATVAAALNGNGPVRNSAYDDPRIKQALPYAEDERNVLKVARIPIPAFDNADRAGDIFREEVEAAVLGMKPVKQALDDLTERVKKLM